MIKKGTIILLVFSICFLSCYSNKTYNTELIGYSNRPVIVLESYINAYTRIINPIFVLYGDGKIYYTVYTNDKNTNYYIKLSKKELDEFIKSLSIDESIYYLDDKINITIPVNSENSSDKIAITPIDYFIMLNLEEIKLINVHCTYTFNGSSESHLQNPIVQLINKIISYRNNDAIEWKEPIPY